jgi:sugar (pentulose or hexulose) kinase
MRESVVAIADIGKTNKKFLIFHEPTLSLLDEVTITIPEQEDDDGFPSDDLNAIVTFINDRVNQLLYSKQYRLTGLNISAYGASIVNVDQQGKRVGPFYNYIKPIPHSLEEQFVQAYGPADMLSLETASPFLGLLNAGLLLYWLKHYKPQLWSKIWTSFHLPNYLAHCFHGKYISEATSVGCHTLLWDFKQQAYHSWVKQEGVTNKLLPLVEVQQQFTCYAANEPFMVGTGLHDSSAALIPYLSSIQEPFILLSTGTWNIAIHPFDESPLSMAELRHDTLFYLSHEGKKVRANRLFMGHVYNELEKLIATHFSKPTHYHREILLDENIMLRLHNRKSIQSLPNKRNGRLEGLEKHFNPEEFDSYEEAYHAMLLILTAYQKEALDRLMQNSPVTSIYVTGGFSTNSLFMQLLADVMHPKMVFTTSLSNASALGSALVMTRGTYAAAKLNAKRIRPRQIQDTAGHAIDRLKSN